MRHIAIDSTTGLWIDASSGEPWPPPRRDRRGRLKQDQPLAALQAGDEWTDAAGAPHTVLEVRRYANGGAAVFSRT
ncbi:MAG: hypothetical protein ACYCW6_25630 [Candidatus Xenobia bacterium]